MPIYEYECKKCGRKKEVLQHSQEAEEPRCIKCGVTMKKLISPSAFILKGSGWYVTDYPSKSRKEAMDAEKKASGKKGKSSPKKDGKSASASHKGKQAKAAKDS